MSLPHPSNPVSATTSTIGSRDFTVDNKKLRKQKRGTVVSDSFIFPVPMETEDILTVQGLNTKLPDVSKFRITFREKNITTEAPCVVIFVRRRSTDLILSNDVIFLGIKKTEFMFLMLRDTYKALYKGELYE